jgi:hypothetical protein
MDDGFVVSFDMVLCGNCRLADERADRRWEALTDEMADDEEEAEE